METDRIKTILLVFVYLLSVASLFASGYLEGFGAGIKYVGDTIDTLKSEGWSGGMVIVSSDFYDMQIYVFTLAIVCNILLLVLVVYWMGGGQ